MTRLEEIKLIDPGVKVIVALAIIALLLWVFNSTHVQAMTRLNAVTGEAEVTPDDGREWTTQLNSVTGEASVQPVGAAVELNAVTGEAEWSSGHE